jgi:hypothetical protein
MAEARRYPIWPDYNAEAEAEALAKAQGNAEALTSAEAFLLALRHAKNITEDLCRGADSVGVECLSDDVSFSETLTYWLRLTLTLRLAEADND